MVELLKNTSYYGFFMFESDAVTNDDWITDHAGDPGELDLSLFTEFTEYIYVPYFDNINDGDMYQIEFWDFTEGETFTYTVGMENQVITLSAVTDSYLTAAKWKKFGKTHNRADANATYWVYRLGAATYFPYYNNALAECKYAPCKVLAANIAQRAGETKWLCRMIIRFAW